MKKKIVAAVLLATLVTVGLCLTINRSHAKLFESNVDILARGEGESGNTTIFTCKNHYSPEDGYKVRDCTTCKIVENNKAEWWDILNFCQ